MGRACTWTTFEVEPARSRACASRATARRSNTASRAPSGPGAPPQNGGVQVYIEDNGKAKGGQPVDRVGDRAAAAAGRLRRRGGRLHRSAPQPGVDAARVRRLLRVRRGLSPSSRRRSASSSSGRVVQLPPGDPDDAPARCLEAPVAGAVLLEGSRVSCVERPSSSTMRRCSGQAQSTSMPSMRTLVSGLGKASIEEEGLEVLFEFASDEVEAALCFFKDGSEDGDARLAGVPVDQRGRGPAGR